jgi:oxidoreductase, short chain dehydrogenase/reductase family protein
MALTDEADIKRGIAAITERFGCIDVTVNNAGYILVGAIEELSDAEIRANFDINVFGMMNVIRAVMPVYRAQKSGRFLNISSISGSVTDPGQAIYSASKAAVIMLTEAMDEEGRDFNVRATAVCPGGRGHPSSAARRVSPSTRLWTTPACATTKTPTAA